MRALNKIVLIAIVFVSCFSVQAQDTSSSWLDAGIGTFGTSSASDGLYYFGALSAQKKNHLIKGRIAGGNEMTVVDIGAEKPSERFVSTCLLYGYGFFSSKAKAYLAAGVGMISGTKRGALISPYSGYFDNEVYEEINFTSVSLPLEADFLFPLGNNFGLGLVIFTDFSPKYAHVGFAVNLSLGKVR